MFWTDRAGNPSSCVFRGCACRCSPRRNPCTCFLSGRARRCQSRRMPFSCFFGGCAGTLRVISSQLRRSHCYCPLLLQAAAYGPRASRGRGTLSLLHSLRFASALDATFLVHGHFLFLAFQASRLPPHPLTAKPLPRLAKAGCRTHLLVRLHGRPWLCVSYVGYVLELSEQGTALTAFSFRSSICRMMDIMLRSSRDRL